MKLSAVLSLLVFSCLSVAGQVSVDFDDPDDVAYSEAVARKKDPTLKKSLSTVLVNGKSLEAATRLGLDRIQRLNIVSMKQVSEIAPNFYFPDYGSRMTSSIYMRGIGARIDQAAVGLMVDGVAILNKDNYDFNLADISRLTVTRGPQSSLYGRNTMAGMITVNTLSAMEFTGVRASVEAGTGGVFKANAGVYVRPTYRLGTSLAVDFSRTGGFFTNRFNGQKADREESGGARWKVDWRGDNSLSVTNTASVSLSAQHGYPYAALETGVINYNDTCYYRRTSFTDGLSVHFKPATVSFTSKTSVQHINDDMTLDQDFTDEDYFTLTQRRNEWAFTQDFTAEAECKGLLGGALDYKWLAGVFGFMKHTDMSAPVTFKQTGIDRLIVDNRNNVNPDYPIAWNDDRFTLGSEFDNPTGGFAFYHRSSVKIRERWMVEAMLRLDYEHTALNYDSRCVTSYTTYDATSPDGILRPFEIHDIDLDDNGRLSKSSLQLLPRLSVNYLPPLSFLPQVYLTVAKGYKAGGYNTQMFSDVLQQSLMETMGLSPKYDVAEIVGYKPEKSWNVEVGGNFAAGTLSGSFALFYIDCRDQQLTMFPDGTTTGRIMTNAGRTRSMGGEVQLSWRPLPELALCGSWGYTDARFVKFHNGIKDFGGKRIPYAPSNTLYLDAAYTFRFKRSAPFRKLTISANCRGVGDIYWDEDNLYRQPLYLQAGASLRLERLDGSLELWVENLTDTDFVTFQYKSVGRVFFQHGKPRRAGVTLRYNLPTGSSKRSLTDIDN